MARAAPVPSLALMNIMNLRELIEKCTEEAELEPNSSITVSDIVAKGNNNHWEQVCSSLVPIIPDIVGISMCALMKNITTIMTRLHQLPRRKNIWVKPSKNLPPEELKKFLKMEWYVLDYINNLKFQNLSFFSQKKKQNYFNVSLKHPFLIFLK